MSYCDYKGMDDIDRIPCEGLNQQLSSRVLAMHTVCRTHFPEKLKFRFGENRVVAVGNPSQLSSILAARADVHLADLPLIFTGEGRAVSESDSRLLTMLKTFAKDITERTLTEHDSSVQQETRNLVSLIAQKAAEM